MTPKQWSRAKEIFAACLDLEPADRTAYLDQTCGADLELRREITTLLDNYDEEEDPLERPPLAEDRSPTLIGTRVGQYTIVRELGEGGMSKVYLGLYSGDAFRKRAAIKLLKRGLDYDFVLKHFRHERQIMAALEHPNIATLLDGGSTEDGVPYFAMEYIQGQPIDRYCDENRLTIAERIRLFCTVCSAVQHAHEQHVVHRDIKPANILITREGVPKLLDFGIAKVLKPELWTDATRQSTGSMLRLMTPEYASPEQARGMPLSKETDTYSLGVLLYELLTGHRPYRLAGQAPYEVSRVICEDEPDKPSHIVTRTVAWRKSDGETATSTPETVAEARRTTPAKLRRALAGDLDNIVLTAMRKEPDRRYGSVAQMADDLRRHIDGKPVYARKDTIVYRSGKFLRRNRTVAVAIGSSVAVALLAIGAMSLREGPEPASAVAAPRVRPFTTLPGNETQPAFSPDGRNIAFVWGGEAGNNFDVYVQPVSGGARLRITTDVAEDVSPVWSPDGNKIAFLRTKRNTTAVYVAPMPKGTHAHIAEVYPNRVEAVGRHLDWSPDGSHLAVADKFSPDTPFSIVLVDLAHGGKRVITTPPMRTVGDSSPAFSPDGKWIAFLRSPSSGITELCVASSDGGDVRQLTDDRREIRSQSWTPDGKAIIFSSNRAGSPSLWRIPVRGGAPRRLEGTGENTSEPSFSRDGKYLAFSQFFEDANIWTADVGTLAAQPFKGISSTQYDSSPAFSPDGKQIAFRSNRSGANEIWTCARDCITPAQLTHFSGPLTGSPSWSPDGKWIAFDSRPEGQPDIYIVASGGGTPRRFTFETAEDVVPRWSRDGKYLYFASKRTGTWQLWKAAVDGGPKVQVTKNGGFAPVESPDGWLYYMHSRSEPGLYRMRLAGGEEESVLPGLKAGYWGYWALAADGLYFADRRDDGAQPEIDFFPFATRVPTKLLTITKRLTVGDSAFTLTPDKKQVLWTQVDQSGSDIMLSELR